MAAGTSPFVRARAARANISAAERWRSLADAGGLATAWLGAGSALTATSR